MTLVWIGMIGFLFMGGSGSGGGGLRGAEEILDEADIAAESTWMGVYLGGSKVGFIHSELNPRPDNGYEIVEISHMSGAMMGARQQMRLKMTVITDSTLALLSFEGSLDASPYNTSFKGWHEERVLHLELTAGEKTTSRVIPAPEPIYLSQAIKPLLEAGLLGANDSLKLSGFDPLSMEMQDLVVLGADPANHMLFGKPVTARKLTTRMGGFESSLFIDEEGNSLGEFGPLGIVLKREPMDEALSVPDGSGVIDFLDLFAINPKGRIDNSRAVVRAHYRVKGIDMDRLVEASGRQFRMDGEILAVDALSPRDERSTSLDSAFLRDAPFIESRDEAIREAAVEAVDGGINRADSLDRLTDWVYRTIAKLPSAGLPSALAVLKTRTGDCNEHSVLFTALARSLGIPTRIELGVVYQAGRFYYHAWPASLIDGRWVEFEPTFGDKRADAARIAFAHGDLSAASELAGVIGKIEIEIISIEK